MQTENPFVPLPNRILCGAGLQAMGTTGLGGTWTPIFAEMAHLHLHVQATGYALLISLLERNRDDFDQFLVFWRCFLSPQGLMYWQLLRHGEEVCARRCHNHTLFHTQHQLHKAAQRFVVLPASRRPCDRTSVTAGPALRMWLVTCSVVIGQPLAMWFFPLCLRPRRTRAHPRARVSRVAQIKPNLGTLNSATDGDLDIAYALLLAAKVHRHNSIWKLQSVASLTGAAPACACRHPAMHHLMLCAQAHWRYTEDSAACMPWLHLRREGNFTTLHPAAVVIPRSVLSRQCAQSAGVGRAVLPAGRAACLQGAAVALLQHRDPGSFPWLVRSFPWFVPVACQAAAMPAPRRRGSPSVPRSMKKLVVVNAVLGHRVLTPSCWRGPGHALHTTRSASHLKNALQHIHRDVSAHVKTLLCPETRGAHAGGLVRAGARASRGRSPLRLPAVPPGAVCQGGRGPRRHLGRLHGGHAAGRLFIVELPGPDLAHNSI